MNLIDVLSEEEINKIDSYRKQFATAYSEESCEERYTTGTYISSREILVDWAKAKEDLYHTFGDKLILEKEVEFSKGAGEIRNQLYDMIMYRDNIFDIRKVDNIQIAHDFYKTLSKKIGNENWMDYRILSSFTDFYTLAKNKYCGENYVFKNIKIQNGVKPCKIIEKLAKYYNIKGFEEFRLIHSLGLNNKKSKGTLCLSIHPLDYMTMSDNEFNWSSCMSWMQDGCYRQGTVEMMNSPVTIVAYLKDNEPVGYGYPAVMWNNKRWRQLFIFDSEQIITGVKQYPSENSDLSNACLNWLKELSAAGTFCDEAVEMAVSSAYCDYDATFDGESKRLESVYFRFETELMYNDFQSVSNFPVFLHKSCKSNSKYSVDYSGISECMCCGSHYSLEHDSLLCTNCYEEESYSYCDNCDCKIYDYDDSYRLGNQIYCECCYNDYAVEVINDRWEDYGDYRDCCKIAVVNEDNTYNFITDKYDKVRIALYPSSGIRDWEKIANCFESIGVKIGPYTDSTELIYRSELRDSIMYVSAKDSGLEKFLDEYGLVVEDMEGRVFGHNTLNWYDPEKIR